MFLKRFSYKYYNILDEAEEDDLSAHAIEVDALEEPQPKRFKNRSEKTKEKKKGQSNASEGSTFRFFLSKYIDYNSSVLYALEKPCPKRLKHRSGKKKKEKRRESSASDGSNFRYMFFENVLSVFQNFRSKRESR